MNSYIYIYVYITWIPEYIKRTCSPHLAGDMHLTLQYSRPRYVGRQKQVSISLQSAVCDPKRLQRQGSVDDCCSCVLHCSDALAAHESQRIQFPPKSHTKPANTLNKSSSIVKSPRSNPQRARPMSINDIRGQLQSTNDDRIASTARSS